ncbi:MAG: signal peptidase II [Gemmatimonadales bacterium]|nr:MAG: signal peptidase II [Gemmatimonadales bacterium]
MRAKLGILATILGVVLTIDRITKVWAEEVLVTRSMELLGGLLPLTLAYNKGAAFGMSIGEDSRWFFIPVTFVALGLLVVLYRQAEDNDRLRLVSLSLVIAGALGNLYDRIFISEGVVDFLGPVNLGFWNFPIFNVADISITCGAILLALSFWQEERLERQRRTEAGVAVVEPTSDGSSEGASSVAVRSSDPASAADPTS